MIGHPGAAADAMTVPGLLAAAAEEFGDRVFLRVGDVTRTYRQSRRAAAETAGALVARGCRPGDRVAVMAGNRIEFVDLILGCAWLGAVLIPLNTGLRGQGLRHILREAEPSFLLAEAESADRPVEAGFRGTLWVVGGDDVPGPGEAPAVPPSPAHPEDTVFVLFTSGTTGTPRGVLCPHAQTVWWGRNVADSLCLTADDVLHTCLPLFHTNALNTLAHAMTVGATCVVGERFSATRYWDQVAEAGATAVYLLGAMAPMLLAQPPGRHDRVHRAWRGLSPATPASAWQPFRERFGVTLVDGFGSTETNLVIGSTPEAQRPGRIGTLREGFSARVVDEHLAPVPDGTAGELGRPQPSAIRLLHRLLGRSRTAPRLLATYGRPRDPRARRLVPLRRPGQGRHPPPRREHLLVRGGVRGPFASRGRRCRGLSGGLGTGGGRGHGGGAPATGERPGPARPGTSLRA
ncbi:acyl-CoA synthetase (AMP-forming)/AMP-acid ligase II [Streptomyces umbrinus]|uniref:Acyl-CoA synthetase (AMP-forming)/AMP-acid ligase II n=1 Tax=Streptomyces umbrinus TaxID=67370 RepID=A0ABU0T913_9ACTN|nr:AMP-binding protein [Streptomyces umbrinus]MDQ1032299.1 acyl-CoA synthetase (AMP-forming)/AMP-acid ligase II [Streptomyces umbrinus]